MILGGVYKAEGTILEQYNVNVGGSMRNITKGFKNVRSKVRRGYIEESLELLNQLQEDIMDKFEAYGRVIEVQNRVCCDISERYLEVCNTDSITTKLTVNGATGRFTLKVNKNCTQKVIDEKILLVRQLMMKEDLPAITLRGKIDWEKNTNSYVWSGCSESKKFKYRGEYKINE